MLILETALYRGLWLCYISGGPQERREFTCNFVCSTHPVLLTKDYSDDQIKKTEMGRARGTYGGEERCVQGLGGKT